MTIKENRNAAANIDQTPAPPTQSPEDNQDMEETEKATMIVVRKYIFFLYISKSQDRPDFYIDSCARGVA